jgi:two-component system response regulator DegU
MEIKTSFLNSDLPEEKMSTENKKGTIMIVEDHDVFREFVHKRLVDIFSDYHFLEAQNGEEALELARKHNLNVVLTDIRLPNMSGIEVVKKIKDQHPKIHVIVLSLYDDPVYKEQAIVAGADAYVLKQQLQSDLIPILKKILPDFTEETNNL